MQINQTICGDSIEIMKKLAPSIVDLIVTSPPYNCGIKYDICDDYRPIPDYYGWCREWLSECYRVLKDNRRIAINVLLNKGNNRRGQGREQPVVEFCNLLASTGFLLNNITLWMDDHRVKYTAWGSWKSASAPYIFCPYEVIIMASKGDWKRKDKGESDITGDEFKEWTAGQWKMPTARNKKCPAVFPEELPRRCIKLLSYKNDIILDPFAGSGTSCVVAKELGRQYIGIDISPDYCEVARKRIEEMEESL